MIRQAIWITLLSFSAVSWVGVSFADVATKQSEKVHLYYLHQSTSTIKRALCSRSAGPIFNRATCSKDLQSVSQSAAREAMEAGVGKSIPTIEEKISDRIARIVDLDRQLLEYFEGSSVEEESRQIRDKMELLRADLGRKESAKFATLDQIARVQTELKLTPTEDLRNLLAKLRKDLESLQAEIATLGDQLSVLTEEFLQSQSGIISEETFRGLSTTRDRHVEHLKALRSDLEGELAEVAAMRRLLGYLQDQGNVYEIRVAGEAFAELFGYLDQFIGVFSALVNEPSPVGPIGPGTPGKWRVVGEEVEVCEGSHWPSEVSAANSSVVVGCVPKGDQRETPSVKFLNPDNQITSTETLLESGGNYYTEVSLSNHNGRFQGVYQYNCDDDGSWKVGWGWGCVDFREWTHEGSPSVKPVVFGQRGHNGHPVLDWNGSSFGVAWVSYSKFMFREVTEKGRLVGRERVDNILLGPSPNGVDSRDGARTQIAWSDSLKRYGVFNICGKELFFSLTDQAGKVEVEPTKIESPAFSDSFKGQFKVIAAKESFYVLFYDKRDIVLAQYSSTGERLKKVVVLEGDRVFPSPITHQLEFPSMTLKGDALIVALSEPDTNAGKILGYSLDLEPDPSLSGTIGAPAKVMIHPRVAYDAQADQLVISFHKNLEFESTYVVRIK